MIKYRRKAEYEAKLLVKINGIFPTYYDHEHVITKSIVYECKCGCSYVVEDDT